MRSAHSRYFLILRPGAFRRGAACCLLFEIQARILYSRLMILSRDELFFSAGFPRLLKPDAIVRSRMQKAIGTGKSRRMIFL